MERRPVADELAARLRAAAEVVETARAKRDVVILEALRSGASLREIGAHVGLSPSQVRNIGNQHGWPDEETIRRRAEREIEALRWRRLGHVD